MEIKVKCNCGVENCSEWAILELQGVVESQPSIANQIRGLEIGRLCCSSSSSQVNYTFTVGYHELSGTKVSLKKPLLVLKKNKQEEGSVSNNEVDLEVIGIIRHKILFKNRPKAIISRPQVKDKKASD
ncbi:Chromosome transmission fidelity protein 8 [Rhynchospora pubera]|uniref:Chromosome transmission fidelity protein 8 n=1 Tax=Rhynchospora pubera TaxID=906938 RepID=A0AAV8CH70_9POAL|nr:Chromosome transmission fidelity protein 8 [Rhynchospora pubera]KAJ4763168.1 Chromosome transmission fidelity protein 8 [Rhynchospora pubera]KAJ4815654.1 Chromosome transmission fidelity protein 8 [Rhynchospora pubera]